MEGLLNGYPSNRHAQQDNHGIALLSDEQVTNSLEIRRARLGDNVA
jgi:hypothetical protein